MNVFDVFRTAFTAILPDIWLEVGDKRAGDVLLQVQLFSIPLPA